MKKMALLALMATLVLGCKNGTGAAQSQEKGAQDAIRAAIQDHLAHDTNLNLQSLDTDVKQVTVQGDHAQAEVEFRLKNGPGAMDLTYALEKRGGAWTVTNTDAAGSTHPGPGETQGNPHGQSQGESSNMPGASHSLADTLKSFGAGPPPATR